MRYIVVINLLLILCGVSQGVFAEETSKKEETPSWKLEFGINTRYRFEQSENMADYNDGINDVKEMHRFRSRIYAKVSAPSVFSFYLGFANEFIKYVTPDKDFTFDEIVFDNCYIDMNNIANKGFSLRLGRQNISKGEGFLFYDGTPNDGTRTTGYNALIASYKLKKRIIDFMAINDPARDQYFPRIGDQEKTLNDWDEQALVLYYTDDTYAKSHIEGYYLFKKESDCILSTGSSRFQPDRDVHTLGARIVHTLSCKTALTGEFAGQYGEEDPDRDLSAWGGILSVKKPFDIAWKPYVFVGYFAYSGDNPDTDKIEGWDQLFGRGTKYGDVYAGFTQEKGANYFTNVLFPRIEFGFQPCTYFNMYINYSYMDAQYAPPKTTALFGTGKHRGDNLQIWAQYKLDKHVSGHLCYQYFMPGSYYAEDDPAYFVQFQLLLSLDHSIKF